ncbi:MAG: glycosyltransferase [Gemmatimonadaceae bacterium]
MPDSILLLVRALTAGGSERQLTEVAKSLDRSRWTPHVGCFHDEGVRGDELRAAGIPVVRFPVTSLSSPSLLTGARAMGRYLRTHGVQLVHTFDTPMNIFGVPTARWYRCPVVLSSQRAYRALSSPRERTLLRVTDRLAHGVVVNCDAMRRHLVDDEHVPASHISLCYNGIDLERFHPAPAARPDFLRDASLVIGCACVLRPEKGLLTLLNAFAEVQPKERRVHLMLVGSGPMQDVLQQRSRELGLEDITHFVGNQSDVAPWLHLMDVFVLPSLSEAFSNSLMEAMACGCTCVASRVGGNPELVREGETGLLFDARDEAGLAAQLNRLVADAGLRQRLAESGARQIRERFSVQQSVRRMGEIYEEALQRT